MADGKKSFVLYCDLIHVVKKLPKDKAGELLVTILEYVNDLNPVVQDFTVELVFEPIKQQLKRDLIKWEGGKPDRVEKAIKAGLASGEARRTKSNPVVQNELGSSTVNSVVQNELNELGATKRTANVNVNVNAIIKQPEPIIKMTGQDFIDFKERMKADALFIESLVMNKIKKNDLDRWINSYHVHITGEDKLEKNYSEYKRHFKNWLNKQDTSIVPVLLNGGTNGKTTPNYIKAESEIDWDKYKK